MDGAGKRPVSSANGGRRASSGSAEFSVVDVTSFFSATASGGVRTYLAAKARALREAGVRHIIVVPGESSGVEEWNSSTLYRIRSPEIVFAPAYRLLVDWRGLAEIFHEVNPSVVEVGSPFTAPILVRRALSDRRVPMVGFYHADLVRTYAETFVDRPLLSPLRVVLRMIARRMIRSIYNRFDATVCASPGVVRELRSLGVRRVHEVPLGVDLELFRPLADRPTPSPRIENGTPVAIYVGRICPEKRLDVLLEGHARLAHEDQPRLVLVGDGSIRTHVAGQAGDAGRVTLLPYVSNRDELVRLYNAADYYVAPGPGETFGLAIGEALACGLPVLCVERGAGPDRIAGSGVAELYRHGDPEDCARAMRAMDRNLRSSRPRPCPRARRTDPGLVPDLHPATGPLPPAGDFANRTLIRRVFVALSLAGVAVATILVLTRSGTPPGALFALPLTHHATALATTLADVVLRGARFVVLGTVMGVLIPLSASTLAHIAADGAGAVTPRDPAPIPPRP